MIWPLHRHQWVQVHRYMGEISRGWMLGFSGPATILTFWCFQCKKYRQEEMKGHIPDRIFDEPQEAVNV